MTLNKFYYYAFGLLSCAFLLSSAVLVQAAADSQNLQTRLQLLLQQASNLPYEANITLEQLNSYPTSLLLSDNQYPDFEHHSWEHVQALWKLHQTCELPKKFVGLEGKKTPRLVRAIEFERAICNNIVLGDDWFRNGELRHPAGGSYADRYLSSLPLDKKITFLTAHSGQLTLSNPKHPLHELFGTLSEAGRDALLSGYRAFLAQDNKLWLNNASGIVSIDTHAWRQLSEALAVNITIRSGADQLCPLTYSNLCIQPPQLESTGIKWLVAILTLLVISFLVLAFINHREEAKERHFILQLLTHELRTPITSLGFTVEEFRKHFDQLNKSAQHSFGRLLADHQRLAQLAETSKGFLSVNPHAQFQKQTAYLSDWLNYCLQKYELNYVLEKDQELTLPYYWLGVCLDNLLRNAQQHGKDDILITVTAFQSLRIEVRDQGVFPNKVQLLIKLFTPKVTDNSMGMGLKIVSRLMKKMGGRLICYHKPTRCILELPL